MTQPWMKLTATVLDAPDANELAEETGWTDITLAGEIHRRTIVLADLRP